MKGKSGFADRYLLAVEAIKAKREFKVPTDAAFCRVAGVLTQKLSSVKRGEVDVSLAMIHDLHKIFGVGLDYLIDESGPMFEPPEGEAAIRDRIIDIIENEILKNFNIPSIRQLLKDEDFSPSSYSNYKEGVVKEPPLPLKLLLTTKYKVNWDYILTGEGEKFITVTTVAPVTPVTPKVFKEPDQEYIKGSNLRILTVSVTPENEENVILVPVTAAASYVRGYADPIYIGQMPGFSFPGLPRGITMRAFEVEGDSMFPTVSPGDIAVCSFVEDWNHIKEGYVHVIVAEDGVYCKRLRNHIKVNGTVQCISDNLFYTPYDLHTSVINEIWQVRRLVTAQLPAPNDTDNRLVKLETTVKHLTEVLRRKQ